MIIFDAHCDTLERITENGGSLFKNDYQLDINRMSSYEAYIQIYAVYTSDKYKDMAYERVCEILDTFRTERINNTRLRLCTSYNQLTSTIGRGMNPAFLSIEGAECMCGNIGQVEEFYNRGIRAVNLTWNRTNRIATSIVDNNLKTGVFDYGKAVVNKMNELGIIIDVSHLSDRSFYDIAEISSKPFMASHSNCRKICSNLRNLTDEQIILMKQKNGVIGVNLYPEFLNNSGKAGLDDIMLHIEHVAGLTGEDNIGFGSDFDGIDTLPEEINGVQDMEKIVNRLVQLNYSYSFIDKICYKNFMRLIKEVIA